jgi:hypothetical protein
MLICLGPRAPRVSPNPGFLAQLELWGEMGCCVDEDHPAYKQFMLDQVRQGKTQAKKQVMIQKY